MLFEPTTIIVSAVMTIMMVGITISILFKNKQQGNSSAAWWFTAFLLTALGFVFFNIPSTPQSSVRVLMNVSFLSGYACAFNGARALAGRKPMLWPVAIALLAWPTAIWSFNPEFQYRSILFSVLVLGYTLGCGWEFMHGARPFERSRRIAALVCGVHAIFYVTRTLLAPSLSKAEGGNPEIIKHMGSLVALEALPFTAIIAILVISISHEQNSQRQKAIAHTDYLTGIGNRRAFEHMVSRHLEAKTGTIEQHLLLLDLDHFKQVNDQLGHEKGDQLLRQFGQIVGPELPQPEQFWRIGGDEFAVLVNHLSPAKVSALVEKLRETVESDQGLADIRASVPLSVSIGVARLTDRDDLTHILRQADTALYQDKFSRRNAKTKSFAPSLI